MSKHRNTNHAYLPVTQDCLLEKRKKYQRLFAVDLLIHSYTSLHTKSLCMFITSQMHKISYAWLHWLISYHQIKRLFKF